MINFKFQLNQPVTISVSGERGEIKGRADYHNSANRYFVRYKSADGTAQETWWDEDALEAVADNSEA